jgi:hypothetical protein
MMKHSVSSLFLLLFLVVLSSLVEVTHARLGDEESASASAPNDDDTPDPTHDFDLVDLPEFQDASIVDTSTNTRDLRGEVRGRSRSRGAFSFLNPKRDELLAVFDNNDNENDVEIDSDDNLVRVMVGFKNDEGRNSARRFEDNSRFGAQRWQEIKNMRVGTMTIPKTSLESLRSNPDIE